MQLRAPTDAERRASRSDDMEQPAQVLLRATRGREHDALVDKLWSFAATLGRVLPECGSRRNQAVRRFSPACIHAARVRLRRHVRSASALVDHTIFITRCVKRFPSANCPDVPANRTTRYERHVAHGRAGKSD
jgi:hypothetical protein